MFCWGNAGDGQLGLGNIDAHFIPTPKSLPFENAKTVVDVACGRRHTILVTETGELFSSGNNDHGQLGRQENQMQFEMVQGLRGQRIVKACCGDNHSLAITEWGQLYVWGADNRGQLSCSGQPQTVPIIFRQLSMHNVVQIASGQAHSLALTNGGLLYSWGANNEGQCGVGETANRQTCEVVIDGVLPIAVIACGANHSVAVSRSGAVYSWGCNTHGQLGLNSLAGRTRPQEVATHRNMKIKYVSCGENFTAFLTADGGVFTCGDNQCGQLGHGSYNNELMPRQVTELMGNTVTQIVCGRNHMMAFIPASGQVYAFGSGALGQLGTEECLKSSTPQIVHSPWKFSALADESVHVTDIYSASDQCFVKLSDISTALPKDHRTFQEAYQIATIDEDIIKRCAQVPPGEIIDDQLFSHLEIIFSSIACLNSSFLTPNDQHYCCTKNNHGIDVEKVERIFGLIAKFQNETLSELVFTGVMKMLRILFQSHYDTELLRAFVILPFYHNFDNPKHAKNLQFVFAATLLSNKAFETVDSWWVYSRAGYFERLVRIYKDSLAYRLVHDKNTKGVATLVPELLSALLMLEFLYETSEKFNLLPYEAFYVNELNETIDVLNDFTEWVVMHRAQPMCRQFAAFPFLFDIEAKMVWLQVKQAYLMQAAMSQAAAHSFAAMTLDQNNIEVPFLYFTVDRNNLVSSTINQLMAADSMDLKKPLRVTFLGEEAEDAGGVRKEFFLLIMKEVLDPKFGMFLYYDETRSIWFNEFSFDEDIMFSLIGMLCGLAIYNSTIINLPFPLALYKKLLGEKTSYRDLNGLSPMLHKGLQDLLDYDKEDVEDVFGLTFVITREQYGEVKNVELKEGFAAVHVTQNNKQEYVDLYADYILNKSVETKYNTFLDGFRQVFDERILQMLHAKELMTLVVGNENYDWDVFESTTEYKGVYSEKHATIRLFWGVFHELGNEEKRQFLLFLTGSDRIPIQGIRVLKMTIQPTTDDKCLPVAHTCFNLLDLPLYQTKERLKYKLLQAIQNYQGFSIV